MNQHDRQSFLGPESDKVLARARVAVIGTGGGGSHIQQQLAHLGVGRYVIADPDRIELTNLNRLVGGTLKDVRVRRHKVRISTRVIKGVVPRAEVAAYVSRWEDIPNALRNCDVVFGCVDSVLAKDQLEAFCRRFLIPYIGIGMDVHQIGKHYLIAGQVAMSVPGGHCLRCMRVVTDEGLTAEARRYGDAGGRPQVVWPNGVLASTAVGLFTQLICPWHEVKAGSALLEYDGNKHTVVQSERLALLDGTVCPHYPAADVGDPFFDIEKPPAESHSLRERIRRIAQEALGRFGSKTNVPA